MGVTDGSVAPEHARCTVEWCYFIRERRRWIYCRSSNARKAKLRIGRQALGPVHFADPRERAPRLSLGGGAAGPGREYSPEILAGAGREKGPVCRLGSPRGRKASGRKGESMVHLYLLFEL